VNIELINTGAELLLGRTLNSHQQWLCRQLADRGHLVSRQVCVDDSSASIQRAVRDALEHADLIITTGGLGPTADDRTRDLVAGILSRKLVEDPTIVRQLEDFFARRGLPITSRVRRQALVPEGAIVLPNPNGTAPGLAIEVAINPFHLEGRPAWLIMLPGPPREMRPMFTASVLPLLAQKFPPPQPFVCRTVKSIGIGESMVEEMIHAPLRHLIDAGLELAYCARTGEVEVRVSALGEQAAALVSEAETVIRALLGKNVFGADDEELESAVIGLLTERQQTLSLAESCTGGLIAHTLTNVPGASAVFVAGFVTYSNEAKQRLLGVDEETLRQHGAVSEPVAREMAEGARGANGTDFALAVTGIAGPDGGTNDKPVGTVFIALAGPEETLVLKKLNPYDRETFKLVTTRQALDMLRRKLAG
jgi:nicotinamide-nucleotide amidase